MKHVEFISLSPYHRREKILDGAARIFAQKGYDAVTTLELSEAVECSESSILQIFHTKTRIYDALFEEWKQAVQKAGKIKIIGGSAYKTLQNYFNKQTTGIPLNNRETRPFLEEAVYSRLTDNARAHMYSVLQAVPDFVTSTLQPVIELGQKQGEIIEGNPEQLAFLLYSLLWGAKSLAPLYPRYARVTFKDIEYIFLKRE